MIVLVKFIQRTTNSHPTCAIRHAPEIYFISYARILHVYSLVSIDTLTRTLKAFVAYLFECQAVDGIGDTFIRMSGHVVT